MFCRVIFKTLEDIKTIKYKGKSKFIRKSPQIKVPTKIKNRIYNSASKIKSKISAHERKSVNKLPKKNRQIRMNDIDTTIYGEDTFTINEIKVKKQLREVMPEEITDDAIDYIINVIKKRGNASTEFGQIFGYKSGKGVSIEFGNGSVGSVRIEATGYKKNKSQMSDEELNEVLKNPMKHKVNYIKGKSNLATQHNHPPGGLYPPSLDDIQLLITQKWADYSICISSKEIWIIEYKGGYYKTAYDEITKKVSKWENEAIELLKNGEYDKANKVYGEKLQNYFNNNEYNIKMYKVEL